MIPSRLLAWACLLPYVFATSIFRGQAGDSTQAVVAPNLQYGHGGENLTVLDAGLFTPMETFDSLSEDTFSVLNLPLFPRYSVRLKRTRFCDKTVRSYTGYIDIEARHIFFYFFESRNDPSTDDVIFWTNGGPGCSSSIGLFMELGPCRVLDENGPKYHPESWNTNANVFFVDQPVGVGYSYADYGEHVSSTEEAAQDIAAFVAIFFENFSQFKGRAFHMSGESYGGRYLPLFASAIYDQNAKLVEAGRTPINLQSVMIGNGMTDTPRMTLSYYDMACTPASVAPVLDIQTCVTMRLARDRCEKWLTENCVDTFDAINCGASALFCGELYSAPYRQTGLNPYDISKPCEGDRESLCYPVTKHIRDYLSKSSVRSNLGVDSDVKKNFTSCSPEVGAAFRGTMDIYHSTTPYVAALLERNIRVLIYVGSYDWICNHVGNERWTLALDWSGKEDFVKAPLRDWMVDGKRAGSTRSANGFTFATVEAAGHMVPYDKPRESLKLIQRWMAKEDL